MTKPIKSLHDLTRCTACRAHIRAADRPSQTDCPFCGANLHTGRARIALPAGRGTLLAASLLAFSACGGGQSEASEPTDTTTEPAGDPSDPSANQNQEPQDQYAPEPADDHNAVAEYGMPLDDYAEEPADNPPPMPRYGLPPSRR
jgi:predicted RNA-binding Zn-ribbon protein involved in translation (DUF1610 family)